MNEQYNNLMEQQNIRADVTAQFYEKLESAETRRKPIHWKIALVAACIALIIPLTALAVEYFFSTPKVKLGKLDWHDSPNGYSVRFDNLDSFPLDTFPKELQTLTEHKIVPYDSWEEAEKALGIDLLNNTFLANAKKDAMYYVSLPGYTHSKILYSQHEGQLFLVSTSAYYRYNDLQLDLKAKITVDHPEMDEESKQVLLGIEGVYTKPANVETGYEEYTTIEGIPVVILRWDLDHVIHYAALFAVNDVSYELSARVNPDREEAEKQILLDALDGFKLK